MEMLGFIYCAQRRKIAELGSLFQRIGIFISRRDRQERRDFEWKC